MTTPGYSSTIDAAIDLYVNYQCDGLLRRDASTIKRIMGDSTINRDFTSNSVELKFVEDELVIYDIERSVVDQNCHNGSCKNGRIIRVTSFIERREDNKWMINESVTIDRDSISYQSSAMSCDATLNKNGSLHSGPHIKMTMRVRDNDKIVSIVGDIKHVKDVDRTIIYTESPCDILFKDHINKMKKELVRLIVNKEYGSELFSE